MLNYNEILENIENGNISIFYSFIPDVDENKNEIINFVKEEKKFDKNSSEFYSKLLYSDRLKLTLGPIIKSHSRKFKSKLQFKNYNDCIDIRKSKNTFVFKPNESITILTNERIKLGKNIACLIFPRVSLSDIGIKLTPAYIDPFYNGILRLLLTNTTNKTYELKLLNVIAQCYFFKINNGIPEFFNENFAQKSVFYGQNWNRILNEDSDPFPTRKKPKKGNKIINDIKVIGQNINHFLRRYAVTVFFLSLFSVVTYEHLSFNEMKDNIRKDSKKINTLLELKKDFNHVINYFNDNFKLRITEIIIKKNKKYGEKKIHLNYPKEDIITVLLYDKDINYQIQSGNDDNSSFLILKYNLDKPAKKDIIKEVKYSIIRRIM